MDEHGESTMSKLGERIGVSNSALSNDRVLNDWIDAHMQVTAETEPPANFRLWCAISAVAAALQRKVWLEWGTTLFPNMYVVLVAPAGRARKGTAMRPIVNYLNKLEIHLSASSTTRESLIRSLAECDDLITLPNGQAYGHSSLSIIAPELTVFLGYNNLQLIADLTDWFDCADKWVYRTKHQGTDDIRGVFVNLLGATTPDLIRTALPTDAIGGGLTSRMIFVYEQNKGKIVPFPFLTEENKVLRKQLHDDLHRIALLKGEYKYSKNFLSAYGDWYVSTENNPPFKDKAFQGYVERRPIHLLKLCMILCAARTNELVLRSQDFNKALNILLTTEKKMPFAFGGVGTQKHSAIMQQIMGDLSLRKEVAVSDLLREYWQDVNSNELELILKTLIQMGYATVTHREGKQFIVKKEKAKET